MSYLNTSNVDIKQYNALYKTLICNNLNTSNVDIKHIPDRVSGEMRRFKYI